MEELDGDVVRISSRGRFAERDIVQVGDILLDFIVPLWFEFSLIFPLTYFSSTQVGFLYCCLVEYI